MFTWTLECPSSPSADNFQTSSIHRAGKQFAIALRPGARGEEEDRVLGLDLGADDYVTKLFSIREVLARVRALLRRTVPAQELPSELRLGDIVVDFRSYEAHRAGERVELTRKEFGLLRVLAASEGRVVIRDELLESVWGYNAAQSTRTADNHVAAIRAKLERDPANPEFVHTVHGVGYKMVRQL